MIWVGVPARDVGVEIQLEKILPLGANTIIAAMSTVYDTRHACETRGPGVGRRVGAGTERVGWRRAND